MKALLALEDGTVLHGNGFGAAASMCGELVFNTSMTGYQEALTDPSYGGQILLMTYPLVGNYGINNVDNESAKMHARGFVVRQESADYSHREAEKSLDAFLKEQGKPGISGVDTRFLVRKIREKGVMNAAIAASKKEIDPKALIAKAREFDYSAQDFVAGAGVQEPVVFGAGGPAGRKEKRVELQNTQPETQAQKESWMGARGRGKGGKKVALLDLGLKMGIVRELVKRGCEVHVLPAYTPAAEIKGLEADGIMLSNGPGDPAVLTRIHKEVKELVGWKPMFGVCLGHQVIAHAMGGSTYKLKFGHRGSNHPVLELNGGRVSITTQNHGFAVDRIPRGFELTHQNLNDRSVEGMRNEDKDIVCVQYHPEASPGPHDSGHLFDEFVGRL